MKCKTCNTEYLSIGNLLAGIFQQYIAECDCEGEE